MNAGAKLITTLSPPSRLLLILTASAAIAILAVRSAIGPFQLWGIHVTVNSPFMAENVFWLAILGLLVFRHSVNTCENSAAGFPGMHLAIALSAIAIAFAHNLADPFLSDDYIILSGPSFHWQTFIAALRRPGGDGSFRPLGTVYYQLLKTVAGTDPVGWHLVGLGLHLTNAALVFVLAWKLWRDKTTAAVTSLVFGLNGTRPEAALWAAGNCDLLACACVLGSICLALPPRPRLALSLVLGALGVLFKESAYSMPLLAFWILSLSGSFRNFRALVVGSLAVSTALFAWRWHLFQGPGGYIDRATGHPAILSLHLLNAAKAVFIRIWAVLLTPVDWDAPMSWWMPIALAASMVGLLLLVPTTRSGPGRRARLCLIAATICAVLPAIHLALIGQSALGSRILYLAGAPFALLIGSLMLKAGKREAAFAAVMLAGMAGILEHNLNAWHKAALQARILCHDASAQPAGTLNGVPLFQNGFHECVTGTFLPNRSIAPPRAP